MPEEFQAKQKQIVRTLQNKLLPTRNKYAHRAAIISVWADVVVTSMVEKGHKIVPITDKEFKQFRKECKHVERMLQEVFTGLKEVYSEGS